MSIDQLWKNTLEKMKKVVKNKQVILNPKKGDKVIFSWKDMKVDPSYTEKTDEYYQPAIFATFKLMEMRVTCFGDNGHVFPDTVLTNSDRSMTLTVTQSKEDPVGVDFIFEFIKSRPRDGYTDLTFKAYILNSLVISYSQFTKTMNGYQTDGSAMVGTVFGDIKFDASPFIEIQEKEAGIEAHDSTLYVGDSWQSKDNFDSCTDAEGNSLPWEDANITTGGTESTVPVKDGKVTTPGSYQVTYTYKGKDGEMGTDDDVSKEITITVKPNSSSIKAHDSTIYVGDSWKNEDNFDSATDKRGDSIPWEDGNITTDGTESNVPVKDGKVTTAGSYQVTYTYKGEDGKMGTDDDVSQEITVTVKPNGSSIKAHDSTIYVGDSWKNKDNFDSATDKTGKSIPWEDADITTGGTENNIPIKSGKVITAGSYKVIYTYKGEDGKMGTDDDVSKEITVTVKMPLSLEIPKSKDFGTYKLGSSNSRLSWKDEKDIKVEDSRNSPWVLRLKADGSIQDYLKLDGKGLTSEVIAFSDSKTNNDIAISLSDPKKGLAVDYSTIEKTRKDSGTLTWTLSPSDDTIKE